MDTPQQFKPASEMVKQNHVRFPNESDEYRRARDALLAEEIELRRHLERVAEQRRALPPGGKVTQGLRVCRRTRPAKFSELFGDKQTLAIYSFMYGPGGCGHARCAPRCSRRGTAMHSTSSNGFRWP